MNLKVMEKHDGFGICPCFIKGAVVEELNPCDEYPHWCSCQIDGHDTFIPDIYVAGGCLSKEYNPTELIVEKNQIVTLIDLVYEWVYVKDAKGNTGWLPASKVISV